MIINERTREIGMMSALGLESREILYLFTMEGAIIGVIGSAIGSDIRWNINQSVFCCRYRLYCGYGGNDVEIYYWSQFFIPSLVWRILFFALH